MGLAIAGVYIACSGLTYAGMTAHENEFCVRDLPTTCDYRHRRSQQAWPIMLTAIPIVGWAAAAIITTGYYDGFEITLRSHHP